MIIKKTKYSFIFVVLTYRNIQDLKDYFKYNKIANSKTIVVNSFYDNESDTEFAEIARINGADFISVPNKGYGAGNNRGIEYALKHFDFEYLVVSNADIVIEKFDIKVIYNHTQNIIAPKILNLSNKNQNPSTPFKIATKLDFITYKIYKSNNKHLIWLIYIISRLSKILYYCISNFKKRIYSAHGAFVIIPYSILSKLVPLYNEDMFLFYEENFLAKKADSLHIKTLYEPAIVIRHKEDGSVSLLNEGLFGYMRDSYMKMYEFWKK